MVLTVRRERLEIERVRASAAGTGLAGSRGGMVAREPLGVGVVGSSGSGGRVCPDPRVPGHEAGLSLA